MCAVLTLSNVTGTELNHALENVADDELYVVVILQPIHECFNEGRHVQAVQEGVQNCGRALVGSLKWMHR